MEYQTFFLIAYRDEVAVFDLQEENDKMYKGKLKFKDEVLEMSIVKEFFPETNVFKEVVIVTTYDNKIQKLEKQNFEQMSYDYDENNDGNMFEEPGTKYQQIL